MPFNWKTALADKGDDKEPGHKDFMPKNEFKPKNEFNPKNDSSKNDSSKSDRPKGDRPKGENSPKAGGPEIDVEIDRDGDAPVDRDGCGSVGAFGDIPKAKDTASDEPMSIGGSGLLRLLNTLMPLLQGKSGGGMSGGPFGVLQDDDFRDDDPVTNSFKKDMGGVGGIVKVIKINGPHAISHIAAIVQDLSALRSATRASALREAFRHSIAARDGKGGGHQTVAARILRRLIDDTDRVGERAILEDARKSVLAGTTDHLDAAAYRVKRVFAASVPARAQRLAKDTNSGTRTASERVAYTQLSTQDGEGYLMCPKAKFQIGKLLPMELSKCRDNCIDSHVAPNGRVSCAYADWIKTSVDTTQAVFARMDTQRHPDNEANLLTLAPGQRDHGYDTRNMETRIDEATKRVVPTDPTEKRLVDTSEADLGHHNDNEKSTKTMEERLRTKSAANVQTAKVNRIDPNTDKTLGEQVEQGNDPWEEDAHIEELLDDERDSYTDDEVEMLIEQLLEKKRSEKPKGLKPYKSLPKSED